MSGFNISDIKIHFVQYQMITEYYQYHTYIFIFLLNLYFFFQTTNFGLFLKLVSHLYSRSKYTQTRMSTQHYIQVYKNINHH